MEIDEYNTKNVEELIIYNAIRTPDGTVLRSRGLHDYVEYKDANGKWYCVDGGTHYLRRSVHEDQEDLTRYLSEGHEVARAYLDWGSYGKCGTQPLRHIKIKDMETDHIEAVLKLYRDYLSPQYLITFTQELKDRYTRNE